MLWKIIIILETELSQVQNSRDFTAKSIIVCHLWNRLRILDPMCEIPAASFKIEKNKNKKQYKILQKLQILIEWYKFNEIKHLFSKLYFSNEKTLKCQKEKRNFKNCPWFQLHRKSHFIVIQNSLISVFDSLRIILKCN